MRIWLGALAVAGLGGGCWGTTTTPDTIANSVPKAIGMFTITSTSFGPIDGKHTLTLQSVRDQFPGYAVKAVWDPGFELHIYSGADQVAFIVLNDDKTSVFNIHATSNKVSVSNRPWRVGAVFHGASELTQCECWGDNPTCFKKGEHVAVNFKRGCDGLTAGDKRSLKVLDGVMVQRLIWSPSELGSDNDELGGQGDGDGDPCGGP